MFVALHFFSSHNWTNRVQKVRPPPRKRKSAARGNHAEHHPGRKPGAQLQRGRPRPRRRGEQRCLVYTVQCVQRWGHGVHRDVVLGHANEVSRAALQWWGNGVHCTQRGRPGPRRRGEQSCPVYNDGVMEDTQMQTNLCSFFSSAKPN